MARFIIVADGMLKKDRDAITTWLHSQSWAFSHWLEPMWLLNHVPDNYTARSLCEAIIAARPSIDDDVMVVLRLDAPTSFWGKANPKLWDWLKDGWGYAG